MMKISTLKFRLISVYLLGYGALACYFPYMAIYFKSKGLTYIETGIAFSVTSLVSIAAQPIMGYISDRYLNKKQVIMTNILACSGLIYLYVFAQGFYTILLAILFQVFFQSSIMSITDAYCYDIADHTPSINYGQIRLAGSFGYALIALILGGVIQQYGIHVSFVLYSFLFILTALFLGGIRHTSHVNVIRPHASDVLDVLKNMRLILFVLSVLILNIALAAHSNYIAMIIEATGGNVSNLGIVWFVQAISEIPLFYFGSRLLRKYGELNIYIFAALLYFVRMLLTSLSSSYAQVIAVQFMQSVTYPLYLFSAMQYVKGIVPDRLRASGITLLSSLGFGLGGLVGNLGGGYLLQYTNPFFLYKMLTVVCLLAAVLALLLKLLQKKNGENRETTPA
jgi:PPP family 3-phenylpropionic acid transporter